MVKYIGNLENLDTKVCLETSYIAETEIFIIKSVKKLK